MSSRLIPSPSATGHAPVLPAECLSGGNVDVVDANVDVVNAMYAELLDAAEIAPVALRSYYVDFYLTQALEGGFGQYVFALPEREEIDHCVREGLAGMGAAAHLDLFNRSGAAFDALSDAQADEYLEGIEPGADAGGESVTGAVRLLEQLDDAFEPLLETEDIVALNADWLRGQPDLLVLDPDDLDRHIHQRVSRIPNLAERQAEAADEELGDADGAAGPGRRAW